MAEFKNKLYVCKDLDDGSIDVGNARAIWNYAEYLLSDYYDEDEDKPELKTFEDALKIIEGKNIVIKEIDLTNIDEMDFDIFRF